MIRPCAAILFFLSGPAAGAPLNFFDDPEPMQVHYLPDGRVSFAKVGEYSGPLKGERCNRAAMKDMKADRVEPVCKPHFVNVPQGVVAPDPHFPMIVVFQSSDAFGYREAHSLSAAGLHTVTRGLLQDIPSVALNCWGCSSVVEQRSPKPRVGGSTPPTFANPPAIPLPASVWMMLAGLAMLWRFR